MNKQLMPDSALAELVAGGVIIQAPRADGGVSTEVAAELAKFGTTFADFKKATQAADALAMEAVTAVGAEATAAGEAAAQAVAQVAGLVEELSDMQQKIADRLVDGQHVPAASVGQMLIASAEFKALAIGRGETPQNGFKLRVEANTITGQGGSPVENVDTLVPTDRRAGITPGAFRSLRVTDLLNTVPTTSNAWQFVRELLFTNNAAEVAEGAAKAETVLTFEDATVNIRTIAHFIKASNQILADAPALAAYIDGRLRYGVDLREDAQLITGNGTGQNISGMLASGNFTAFSPTTGDTALDSLNRAKYAIIGADYVPDGVLMNPADWGAIERLKTSDLAYVVGNPFGQIVPIVWGLPVVASNNMTAGSFLMADFFTSYEYLSRMSTVVDIGYVNDDFTKNLVTIRAEKRSALATIRPASTRSGTLTV